MDPHPYDDFAKDYHWLFTEHGLSGERYIEANDALFKSVGPDGRILDCGQGLGRTMAGPRYGPSRAASGT